MRVDLSNINNDEYKNSILSGIKQAKILLPGAINNVSDLTISEKRLLDYAGFVCCAVCVPIKNPKIHYKIILSKELIERDDGYTPKHLQIKMWVIHEFCHSADFLYLFNTKPIYARILSILKNLHLIRKAIKKAFNNYYFNILTEKERILLKYIYNPNIYEPQEFFPLIFEEYIRYNDMFYIPKDLKEKAKLLLIARIVKDYREMIKPQNEAVLEKYLLYVCD